MRSWKQRQSIFRRVAGQVAERLTDYCRGASYDKAVLEASGWLLARDRVDGGFVLALHELGKRHRRGPLKRPLLAVLEKIGARKTLPIGARTSALARIYNTDPAAGRGAAARYRKDSSPNMRSMAESLLNQPGAK